MFQYILTLILMLSLGAVLYLVARSLPRVSAEEGKEDKRGLVERWVTSEFPEKADEALLIILILTTLNFLQDKQFLLKLLLPIPETAKLIILK